MRFLQLTIVFLVFTTNLSAQANHQKKIKLPKELSEISGLVSWQDSLLIAINDSGNSAEVFFLSEDGRIMKRTILIQQQNTDWEDLTMDDKGNLYIADVGNNLNNRRDLSILKVSIEQLYNTDSTRAEKLCFSYEDQVAFPPSKEQFRFNCEAIFWKNDSIFLITKNESKIKYTPDWERAPRIYAISDQPGNYTASQIHLAALNKFRFNRRGISELVTAAHFQHDQLILLTYKKIITFPWSGSDNANNVQLRWRQHEAISCSNSVNMYIGAEHHRFLGGPFLIKRRCK